MLIWYLFHMSQCCALTCCFKSLSLSHAIWQHRSGSPLTQVMACCLAAPSHYLTQCWLLIPEFLCHSHDNNFTANPRAVILYNSFENCSFRINTLRPRQNGRHFADDIFKCIFLDENVWIPIKISLKFLPQGPINNIPAFVKIMAWRRPGDKPWSGPMIVRLMTHLPGANGLIYQTHHNLPSYLSENPVSVVLLSVWNLTMVKFEGASSKIEVWLPQYGPETNTPL